MYMNLEKKMCKELEAMEEKYRSGAEMSEGDLRRIDLLLHSLKSMAAYKTMRESEDQRSGYADNRSYSRPPYSQSPYMNNSQSGYYMERPYYQEERRW